MKRCKPPKPRDETIHSGSETCYSDVVLHLDHRIGLWPGIKSSLNKLNKSCLVDPMSVSCREVIHLV